MEQSIKQAEPSKGHSAAEAIKGEPAEEVKTERLRKKHKVRDLIKEMWPAYLIEIFVIILGISITLALEEWRDNNKEEKLEKIYQKNLLADVNNDLRELKYAANSTKTLLNNGNDLLQFIKSPEQHNLLPRKIYEDVRSILGRPNFISSDATFSDLKNSGNLKLLKDIQLKNLLFAYYTETQIIKETQNVEQQATITISGAYFLKWFPIGDVGNQQLIDPILLKNLSKNVEFGNNVLLRVINRNELFEKFKKADLLGSQLRNILNEKVNE